MGGRALFVIVIIKHPAHLKRVATLPCKISDSQWPMAYAILFLCATKYNPVHLITFTVSNEDNPVWMSLHQTASFGTLRSLHIQN